MRHANEYLYGTQASPRRLARIAGGLYLVNIVGGAFAIGFVRATLFTPDPATTLSNIEAHELLYRSSLAAHLVVTLTNVPLALIFYELFKVVDRRVALLDAFFVLVATAIEAAGLAHQFAPLAALAVDPTTGAASAARESLTVQAGALSDASYDVYTAFFAFDILCLAYLIFRSRFVPRTIAVLLAVDGLAYLVYGFTDVLAPGSAAQLVPWILLPAPIGEGALTVWLIVRGVDVERWRKAADGLARPEPSLPLL